MSLTMSTSRFTFEEAEMASDGLEIQLAKAEILTERVRESRREYASNDAKTLSSSNVSESVAEERDDSTVRSTTTRNSEVSSTQTMYDNWVKWLVENNYAKSEEQVRDFMGVRPRRHYPLEGDITSPSCMPPWARQLDGEEGDHSRSCMQVPPWARQLDGEEDHSRSCLSLSARGDETRSVSGRSLPASMQRILDEDGQETTNSCLADPWGVRPRYRDEAGRSCFETPWMRKDSSPLTPEEEEVEASRRRLSKLKTSLASIRCIVGNPKEIQDGDDSIATGHCRYEAIEQEPKEDKPIKRLSCTRRVTFLDDMVDPTDEVPRKRRAEQEQERIHKDLEKLQQELEELRLIHCIDDTQLWLDLHDEFRDNKRRDSARRDSARRDNARRDNARRVIVPENNALVQRKQFGFL